MKRLFFLLLAFLTCLTLFAQEPGNNLHKSITQIQQSFPNLKFNSNESGFNVYISDGDDQDFTSFYFSNGKLVGEYSFIFDYSGSGFITDLYTTLLSSFSKYGCKQRRNVSSRYDVSFFYFSDFIVKVANYHTQLQLFYELNGLNIRINALESHPPY